MQVVQVLWYCPQCLINIIKSESEVKMTNDKIYASIKDRKCVTSTNYEKYIDICIYI